MSRLPDESARITVAEIAARLNIGTAAIYLMLGKEIPALRPQRRWIISRAKYEQWERTFGRRVRPAAAHAAEAVR